MEKQRITVLMAIYNCAATLDAALQSLINQTYKNWICILCDDASTDDTYLTAKKYADRYSEHFLLIKNVQNKGLNFTLNRCLEYAETEYVARMDGDDISLPDRFEREIDFLDNNREFDIVSCPMIQFDENGDFRTGKAVEIPTKQQVVTKSVICHAPSMIRTKAIKAINGYTVSEKVLRVEDVDLWIRLYANGSRCYNIQTPLYKMRDDRNATSRRKFKYRINSTRVRLNGCKLHNLGFKYKMMCFRPIIIGLLPKPIYRFLHKKQRG
ncbi:MAG: glycosyltransferase [Ruminococcus sp.]|nr:glycosyltransferase [Ruminococcus sp.]